MGSLFKNNINNNTRNSIIKISNRNTRFPPEPSGFIHLGHLKAIYINKKFRKGGDFILRIDDTNPEKSKLKYVKSIINDIKKIRMYKDFNKITFTSDYFEDLYKIAIDFIKKGLAYVEKKGFIVLSIKENLKEFKLMKKGFYKKNVFLKSKMFFVSKNFNIKNNIMYRIKKQKHYITKRKWKIFPTYNFSHCLCDNIEEISNSFCSNEFENNRFIYEWYLKKYCFLYKNNIFEMTPKQLEFSKLKINNTILGKRKIKEAMIKNKIKSWSNSRIFTIRGLINRGFKKKFLINFCKKISFNLENIDFSLIRKIAIKSFKKKKNLIMLNTPFKIIKFENKEIMINIIYHKIIKLRYFKIIVKKLLKFEKKYVEKKYENFKDNKKEFIIDWLYFNERILVKVEKIYTLNLEYKKNLIKFFYLNNLIFKKIKKKETFIIEKLGYFKKINKKKIREVIVFKNSKF